MERHRCFVFDDRVTVDHGFKPGSYDQCNACRMPITKDVQQSEYFEQCVSCPHCFDKSTAEQKVRYQERDKQIRLAKARGEQHVGGDVKKHLLARREMKKQQREKLRKLNQAK